ncbi:MAG: NAD(P)H-dependent oxidoreductase [Desulfovibrio sp.]|nr:NAD(P)H-dependent oxidoreductase [Desulfovibrio sp.]MBI4959021.1 NAD(P)H-dependent oxidoreductase [Desulfovibrio sp.]
MSKVLLLIGSPRSKSTSRVLGEYLVDGLTARGWQSETLVLPGLLEAQEGRARLWGEFLGAELTILAAPVYADSPPAPVMRALEFLAEEPGQKSKTRRFAAVFNCGFPEPEHTSICLDVCRLFSRKAGLTWAGGLGIGGGGTIDGARLTVRGNMTRNLRRALETAAQDLASGREISLEAQTLAAKPIVPPWLYLLLAETGWWLEAWKRRTLFKLGDRPFRKP